MSPSLRIVLAPALVVALAAAAPSRAQLLPAEQGESWETLELPDGAKLEWALVLPDDFNPDRTWPVLLALPGGKQDREEVHGALMRFWGLEASQRGWIVASPTAPGGVRFHEGAERHLLALLNELQSRFQVEGGRFHLAGTSTGGLGAFRMAILHPQLFHSLVVLPGGPVNSDDVDRLGRLQGLVVRMFAGGKDAEWTRLSEGASRLLRQLGVDVELEIARDGEHVPWSILSGGRVMAVLENIRGEIKRLGPPPGDPNRTIDWLLDRLAHAVQWNDVEGWKSVVSPHAVVLGSSVGERWRVNDLDDDEIAALMKDEAGGASSIEHREVFVDRESRIGWFDELRRGEDGSLTRRSGVALQGTAGWRIAHLAVARSVGKPDEAGGESASAGEPSDDAGAPASPPAED